MKKNNWNLSEKIRFKSEIETDNPQSISVIDVKEFIKRLKEEVNEYWTNGEGQCICPECWENREGTKEDYYRTKSCMFLKIFKKIDTLAGSELTNGK
jgi:hypothetical protein